MFFMMPLEERELRRKIRDAFDLEKYDKYCDLIDDGISKLLRGEAQEVFIDQCDIYKMPVYSINYAEEKRKEMKRYGYDLICIHDDVNYGFIMKLKKED